MTCKKVVFSQKYKKSCKICRKSIKLMKTTYFPYTKPKPVSETLPSLEHGITQYPQRLLNYFQGPSFTYIVFFKDIFAGKYGTFSK